MDHVRLLSIDGNIGSGKSTILEELKVRCKDDPNIIFLDEPLHIWSSITDNNGVTILEKFYSDKKRYSFAFQTMAFISRMNILMDVVKKCTQHTIIICERSLLTDRYVFAQMLYDSHMFEDIEMKIYLQWFNTFVNQLPVTHVVYINTDPHKCLERVNKRNRKGEDKISEEYLTLSDKYHKNMIDGFKDNKKILIINGNIDYEIENKLSDNVKSIIDFAKK